MYELSSLSIRVQSAFFYAPSCPRSHLKVWVMLKHIPHI